MRGEYHLLLLLDGCNKLLLLINQLLLVILIPKLLVYLYLIEFDYNKTIFKIFVGRLLLSYGVLVHGLSLHQI